MVGQLGSPVAQLRGLALGPDQGAAIAAAVAANDVMTSLDLSDNGLNELGLRALFR